jgi:nucleoside-diphosphate-sugar epimerase
MEEKMKKPLCLVTGACGFMGTHMVEVLSEAGYQVRATDLPSSYPNDDRKGGKFPSVVMKHKAEFVGADLTDESSVKPLVKDVEYVFHIAGLFNYSATWDAYEAVNVGGTRNLLDAIVAEGKIKRLIMWGAGGVYGLPTPDMLPLKEDMPTNPPNNYLKSKDLAEKLVMEVCEKNKIPYAILRPTTVYGPRAVYGGGQLVMQLYKMNPLAAPSNFTGRIPFIHVTDVCKAALHLAEYQGEIRGPYNVNDDSQMTQVDLMRFFAQLTGAMFFKLPPVPVKQIKKVAVPVARVAQKVVQDVFHAKSPVEADTVEYLNVDMVFSNEKLKATGYQFVYPDARHGLRDTVQWYRDEGWI